MIEIILILFFMANPSYLIPVVIGLVLYCMVASDTSFESSSDCCGDDEGSVIDDIALGAVAGMLLEDAYRKDVQIQTENQRLIENDPMAEFRI